MAKKKRISINTFDKIYENNYSPVDIVEVDGNEITITKTLSFSDALSFIKIVTESCFADGTGEYLPEVKTFIIDCCIIDMYSNMALPANVEHKYKLIYCTDVVEIIKEHINIKQFNDITFAIDQKIDNILKTNISIANKQLNEAIESIENVQAQMSGLLSEVDSEGLLKFIDKVSNMPEKLDEKKIVKSYIESTRDKHGDLSEVKHDSSDSEQTNSNK